MNTKKMLFKLSLGAAFCLLLPIADVSASPAFPAGESVSGESVYGGAKPLRDPHNYGGAGAPGNSGGSSGGRSPRPPQGDDRLPPNPPTTRAPKPGAPKGSARASSPAPRTPTAPRSSRGTGRGGGSGFAFTGGSKGFNGVSDNMIPGMGGVIWH